MRILNLVHQYLPDKVGGTERYTQGIAHALAQRGHQVGVFYRRSAAGAGVERREDTGVTVWAAWSGAAGPTRRFLATFGDTPIERAFGRVLDESRPDLVHVQHMMGLPAALLDTLHRRRIPTVITLHDYWWVCANAQLVTNYDQSICAGPRHNWFNCSRCALARGGADALGWPRRGFAAPGRPRTHLAERPGTRRADHCADRFRQHGMPRTDCAICRSWCCRTASSRPPTSACANRATHPG